eukprot:TRINITY_DN77010_c0_g1_i1.p1 TRINITY_DN77010_c0_g1~~TRINITY_DN77010_c0_g1_i1.p1  ORF type:complete len:262 (-),score=40.16 TRINITY_DN77010_c0_g1_i1:76-765(-)
MGFTNRIVFFMLSFVELLAETPDVDIDILAADATCASKGCSVNMLQVKAVKDARDDSILDHKDGQLLEKKSFKESCSPEMLDRYSSLGCGCSTDGQGACACGCSEAANHPFVLPTGDQGSSDKGDDKCGPNLRLEGAPSFMEECNGVYAKTSEEVDGNPVYSKQDQNEPQVYLYWVSDDGGEWHCAGDTDKSQMRCYIPSSEFSVVSSGASKCADNGEWKEETITISCA